MTHNRNTGHDLVVLAAGIATGILGSRLLPPLVAMASGSMRVRNGQDPFDLLIQDHRTILSVLDKMASEPADSNVRRPTLFLLLKRTLGKHALAEEDVVYPLLHGRGHDPQGSKELYDEHADMKILLFELEECLLSKTDWSEPVGRLRDLIQEHVKEEEEKVFPSLKAMLDETQAPKVSGQIRREEALIL
jgi:hemerythrin superfamily protein